MNKQIENHLQQVLKHLYINPLERCNLRCKICYTRKTSPILKEEEILEFINRYKKAYPLETVTFCGGEVFTLPYFTRLVNRLKGIIIQIITNGTLDRLEEFENPNLVNLIVSLDGLPQYHDKNRGIGNFEKSINFLKKAGELGFHTEVFSIVTRQNYKKIEEFERCLNSYVIPTDPVGGGGAEESSQIRRSLDSPSTSSGSLGMTEMHSISVTYHPRKPPAYLLHHPVSNITGEVDGFDFLADKEMAEILKTRKTFPPKELGCYQIALVSDGKVYGCCEGTVPIGKMTDDIGYLFDKMRERLVWWDKLNKIKGCLGCSQPDFVCGIRKFL